MRHRLGYRKLNKGSAERKALLRGLATQLIQHGRVETTLERAKELRRVVEPLITKARDDSVAARRIASRTLYTKESVRRLFADVAPANIDRAGGYTRILKLGFRPGDNARRALIEFVEAKLFGEDAVVEITSPVSVTAEQEGEDGKPVGSVEASAVAPEGSDVNETKE